jgi:hypothetical protein
VQGLCRFDVFREPSDGPNWTCRRDPTIRRPHREIVRHTADAVPYPAPEVVLLFKAKHARPQDEADLTTVLPPLGQPARAWLTDALERIHPGHRWLERLS